MMTSRFRLRYIVPAIAIALLAGLTVKMITSGGTVLGYSGFSHLTEERHDAINYQQVSPDATPPQSGSPAQADGAEISPDEAVEIAQTAAPGPVSGIEVERRDDRIAFDIEIGETDVLVDAADGTIIRVETDDRDDDDDDWDDRDNRQAQKPVVTVGAAIRMAEEATSGAFEELELEYERGRLVYSIEIGSDEVIVDAIDGSVLSVHADD